MNNNSISTARYQAVSSDDHISADSDNRSGFKSAGAENRRIAEARAALEKIPAAVSGRNGHGTTFRAACMLVRQFQLSEGDAMRLLKEWNKRCRPPWSEPELEHKIRDAAGARKAGVLTEFPPPDPALIKSIPPAGGLAGLRRLSPVSSEGLKAFDYLSALFPKTDPLVCYGRVRTPEESERRWRHTGKPPSDWDAVTRTKQLSALADVRLDACSFIVPSPMSKLLGVTQKGTLGPRARDNAGPKLYQVIEFDDHSPLDSQADRLLHLARFMPLRLVVFSGGKSLHGWFLAKGRSESSQRQFMAHACELGADKGLWWNEAFVRMPNGLRVEDIEGRREMFPQPVHFFNPKPAEVL